MSDVSLAFPEIAAAARASGDVGTRPSAEPQDELKRLADDFSEVLAEKVRMRVWAEAIRSSATGGSFMVLRPAPDWPRSDYPTAIAAYRELSKVVDQL
ncbi:MAG: hypothetical protein JNL61_14940 [Rhizobiaceae bacterium]|nr:hypothetical protein [Rhizobiaceae bacterium]